MAYCNYCLSNLTEFKCYGKLGNLAEVWRYQKNELEHHHHHGITITKSCDNAETDRMAQNVNNSQHERPHNSTNNENCCHRVTSLHTISEEVCKAIFCVTGWNYVSGFHICEMKENIFLILFGQYDVVTFEHTGTVNSVRNGLLIIDSWREKWVVYLLGMSVWWGLSSIRVNRGIFLWYNSHR